MKATATLMRDNTMPAALVHGSTTLNRFLPAALEWVDKTSADVKSQRRSYLAGVQSSAEFLKEQNARQKLAAAKKLVKATKKKAE